MPVDAIAGAGWIGLHAADPGGATASTVAAPQIFGGGSVVASRQTAGAARAATDPAISASATKPKVPLLMVPTTPLTPTVLAELIGRQPPVPGFAGG